MFQSVFVDELLNFIVYFLFLSQNPNQPITLYKIFQVKNGKNTGFPYFEQINLQKEMKFIIM